MRVHKILFSTLSNSPDGTELADTIWFCGCSIRCPGCVNKNLWDREAGREMHPRAVERALAASASPWVSLSGGEPLEQKGLLELIKALSARKKVLLNTGRTILDAEVSMLLPYLHAIKYGPFVIAEKGGFGSKNQVMLARRQSGLFQPVAAADRREYVLENNVMTETGYG
jgi:pyruvate-formate lyase-activating enzyme